MCVSRIRPWAAAGSPSLVTIAAGVPDGAGSAGFAPVAAAPPQPASGDSAKRRTQLGMSAAMLVKIFMGIPLSFSGLVGEVSAEVDDLNVLLVALGELVAQQVELGEEGHAGKPMPLHGC